MDQSVIDAAEGKPIVPEGARDQGSFGDQVSAWWNEKVRPWWDTSWLNPGNWQDKIFSAFGVDNIKDYFTGESTNSAATEGKIAYTDSGIAYDANDTNSMIDALRQEYANQRDDTSYSRLIKQLKDNGINPAIALSNSASAMSSDSGVRNTSAIGAKDQLNSAIKLGTLLVLLMKFMK